MQRARLVASLISILAFALLCGGLVLAQSVHGNIGQFRPGGTLAAVDPTGRSALLFVSTAHQKTTVVLNAELKQVAMVSAPYGYFAIDGAQRFYDVPENQHRLLVFSPPYQRLSAKIDFGEDTPKGVAIDAINGVVAVPIEKNANGGPGPWYINFYSISQSGPVLCDTVQTSAAGLETGAFDREGTLFLEDFTYQDDGIGTVVGGCKATALEFNTIPSQYSPYFSPVFTDSDDNIVFEGANNVVLTFAHPISGMFGKPIAITTLQSKEQMFFQCLTSDGKHLWASPLYQQKPKFTEFTFPGGGLPLKQGPVADVGVCASAPAVLP